MRISNKQIAVIAKESKQLSRNGCGIQLAIFADGSTSFQPSRQSLTCFIADDGSRTYPLCWLSFPQPIAGVRDIVRQAEQDAIRQAEYQDRIG